MKLIDLLATPACATAGCTVQAQAPLLWHFRIEMAGAVAGNKPAFLVDLGSRTLVMVTIQNAQVLLFKVVFAG